MSELSFMEAFQRDQQKLMERIQSERRSQLAALPPKAIEWLLVVPAWTPALARACGFPSGHQDVGSVLRRMREMGLCVSRRDEQENEETEQFWMLPELRAEQLQQLSGGEHLQPIIVEIGGKIRKQADQEGLVPSAVLRWAELAAEAKDVRALETELDAHITQLLSKEKPLGAGERPAPGPTDENIGEAVRWVEAARRLEPFFGPILVSAVARAWRRVELSQLQMDDERRLGNFIVRDAQVRAFQEFLHQSSEHWALHYVGQGGMGKTMLVRYISAHLIPQHGGSSARIDFDHLNPDFPSRAPWLLLERMAEQLRLYDQTGRANRLFQELDRNVLRLRESTPRTDLASEVSDDILKNLLALPFAEALGQLPQPTVLIFDTCEELAKVRVDGDLPSNVRVTFRLIELIREWHSGLRVVFCGRRPLASAGPGWSLKDAPAGLPPCYYLRLHEIRGFTHEEAVQYLHRVFVRSRRAEDSSWRELLPPILQRSRQKASSSRFEWHDQKGAPKTDSELFNPFDLALYVNWAARDVGITPKDILAADGDRYVQFRIVDRISHPGLRALLPALSLLRRFDRQLLASLWDGEPSAFESAFHELLRQEWLGGDGRTYQVEEGLGPRLERYLERTSSDVLRATQERVTGRLEMFTTQAPFEYLEVFHFNALVRLLGPTPQRALRWWEAIERRIAETSRFEWARRICEELLAAEEGPLDLDVPGPRTRATLRAAVLATYAATLLQAWNNPQRRWDEVLLLAPPEAARLRCRAIAGRVGAGRFDARELDQDEVEEFWRLLDNDSTRAEPWDEQLLASFIAAIEAILEEVERTGQLRFAGDDGAFQRLFQLLSSVGASNTLRAFALSLAARRAHLHNRDTVAEALFTEALKRIEDTKVHHSWLDWKAPQDVGARIWLEYIRAVYPASLSPEHLLERFAAMRAEEWRVRMGSNNIDSDRLAAAWLTLEASVSPGRVRHQNRFTENPSPLDLQEECNAHRAFPPALVVFAEQQAMEGRWQGAREQLTKQIRSTELRALSVAGANAADITSFRMSQRMRDFDTLLDMHLSEALSDPAGALPPEFILIKTSLQGLAQPDFFERFVAESWIAHSAVLPSLWRHACWRSSPIYSRHLVKASLRWASKHLRTVSYWQPTGFSDCACLLDEVEANYLAVEWKQKAYLRKAKGLLRVVTRWCTTNQARYPVETLRLRLRLYALGNDLPESTQPAVKDRAVSAVAIHMLGKRRVAEMAREEGELLAMRLPKRGAQLLMLARKLFQEIGDPVGAFIAGTCTSLALSRTRTESIAALLDSLSVDYQRMELELPEWKQLWESARDSFFDILKPYWHTGWGPWLLRLMVCMACAPFIDNGATERTHSLFQALDGEYGRKWSLTSRRLLPTELELFRASLDDDQYEDWVESDASTAVSSMREPTPRAQPSSAMLESPRDSLELTLRWLGESGTSTMGAMLRVMVQVGKAGDAEVRIDPRAPYTTMRKELPLELRSVLRDAFQEKVDLWLAPEVAAPCWEYILGSEFEFEPWNASVRFRRLASTLGKRAWYPTGPLSQLRVWCDGSFQHAMVRNAWGAWWGGELQFMQKGIPIKPNDDMEGIHIIALADSTSRGIRLQVVDEEYQERQTRSRQEQLAAVDLLRSHPNLQLCILQGVPLSSPQRLTSERLQSARLRQFAAELAQAGTLTAVVVIPSLHFELAQQVLTEFSRELAQEDWPRRVDERIPALRRLILEYSGLSHEDAEEAAMDLCLYLSR